MRRSRDSRSRTNRTRSPDSRDATLGQASQPVLHGGIPETDPDRYEPASPTITSTRCACARGDTKMSCTLTDAGLCYQIINDYLARVSSAP